MNEKNLGGIVTNLAAVPGVTLALSASIAVQCVGLFSETVARILAIPVDVSVEATALFVRMMARWAVISGPIIVVVASAFLWALHQSPVRNTGIQANGPGIRGLCRCVAHAVVGRPYADLPV